MTPSKRDWHLVAAELRTETDAGKILSLALELEDDALENNVARPAEGYSPRIEARAKWGDEPQR
jgi:hypothetical protein